MAAVYTLDTTSSAPSGGVPLQDLGIRANVPKPSTGYNLTALGLKEEEILNSLQLYSAYESGDIILYGDGNVVTIASRAEQYKVLSANAAITALVTEITGGTSYTIPAAKQASRRFKIINASAIPILLSSSSTIGNRPSQTATSLYLKPREWLDIIDNGSSWRIV